MAPPSFILGGKSGFLNTPRKEGNQNQINSLEKIVRRYFYFLNAQFMVRCVFIFSLCCIYGLFAFVNFLFTDVSVRIEFQKFFEREGEEERGNI